MRFLPPWILWKKGASSSPPVESFPPKSTRYRDRGPAKHWNGRKEILDYFLEVLKETEKVKGGPIFLVQGAPGVGKTALLDQCMKIAKGWKTVVIKPESLWDTSDMMLRLGAAEKGKVAGFSAELGGGYENAHGTVKFEIDRDTKKITMEEVIEKESTPLLLVLDEAQALGLDYVITPERRGPVRAILDKIHNGDFERPVLLLAAGLGMTARALKSLNISRLEVESRFEMGALDKEEEIAVIVDWMRKEGNAKGDLTEWIDRIMQETHGWPQHIIAYMKPAVRQIRKDNRKLTPKGLDSVLKVGEGLRLKYYKERTEDLTYDEFNGLTELFQHVSLEVGLTDEEIKRVVGEGGFERALSEGVLYKKGRRYSIPIPSLRDYMVREWLIEKERSKQLLRVKPEKEVSQKELKNHVTDRSFPRKEEEEKEPMTPKSRKGNPDQDTPQSKDTFNRKQDTDRGMER